MAKPAKYKKAVQMTVAEALGIDEETIKQKQAERLLNFEMSDLAEAHKQDAQELKAVHRGLDKHYMKFKNGKTDRKPVEEAYAREINLTLSMAKRFHPLSTYGRQMLAEAEKSRREFEDLVGPLVTNITAANLEMFSTVLPEEFLEDITTGRLFAIGALRTDFETTYGAGAVVYRIDQRGASGKKSEKILRIEWVFVDPMFRKLGVCTYLLGELINRAAQMGIENVSMDFPANNPHNNLLGYIIGTWHFEFGSGISPETVVMIRDILSFEKISDRKKGVKALSSLDESERTQLQKMALRKFGYRGYLTGKDLPADYFDYDLSCYAGTPTDPVGMLLVHITKEGILREEYLGAAKGKDDCAEALICSFLYRAVTERDPEERIMISYGNEGVNELLLDLCPRQLGQYLVNGTMNRPETDMTADDVEVIMQQPKEEPIPEGETL